MVDRCGVLADHDFVLNAAYIGNGRHDAGGNVRSDTVGERINDFFSFAGIDRRQGGDGLVDNMSCLGTHLV